MFRLFVSLPQKSCLLSIYQEFCFITNDGNKLKLKASSTIVFKLEAQAQSSELHELENNMLNHLNSNIMLRNNFD